MTKLATIAAFAALVMTSAAARADQKKHEEKYCSALSAVSDDLKKLDKLGPDSKLSELRAQVQKIDGDAQKVDKEARKIHTETSKQFVQSVDQLQRELQALPDSMTIAEARARVRGDVQAVKRSARDLANESGCPEAMPKETESSGT